MANPFAANHRSFRVTPLVSGQIAELGPGGQKVVGTIMFQWVPDASFQGSLIVVGRALGIKAAQDPIGPQPVQIPYRRMYVDGVAYSDFAFQNAQFSGPTYIQIPANGIVGVLINCVAGFGYWYMQDLNGPSVP